MSANFKQVRSILPAALLSLILAGCGIAPLAPPTSSGVVEHITVATSFEDEPDASPMGKEVVMFSLMLLKTGYRFGGKNPQAGLDCSGLVTYVFKESIGMAMTGNAATLAKKGRQVALQHLRSGDLVFFNTLGRSFSHVGIYIGKGEFLHAPNSRGSVRVDKMNNRYWAQRFEMGRTLLG